MDVAEENNSQDLRSGGQKAFVRIIAGMNPKAIKERGSRPRRRMKANH